MGTLGTPGRLWVGHFRGCLGVGTPGVSGVGTPASRSLWVGHVGHLSGTLWSGFNPGRLWGWALQRAMQNSGVGHSRSLCVSVLGVGHSRETGWHSKSLCVGHQQVSGVGRTSVCFAHFSDSICHDAVALLREHMINDDDV